MSEHSDDDDVRQQPAYLRLAAQLRSDIASGRFGPGGKLPSETQLMMRHGVSRSVTKWAISVLKTDGLVDGRQGAGVFVREPDRSIREANWPGLPSGTDAVSLSPASSSMSGEEGWHIDPWSSRSDEIPADPAMASRLAIEIGAPVVRALSRYVSQANPQHRALVTTWQPVSKQQGDIDPGARRADEQHERIIVRPARPEEIVGLALPERGAVLVIAGTFTLKGVPVETFDVILASERCELSYRLLVE